MEELEQLTEKTQNPLMFLGVALLALLLFGLAGYLLARKLGPTIQKHINEEKHPIPVLLLGGFRLPVQVGFLVCGLGAALLILSGWQHPDMPAFLANWLKSAPAFVSKMLRISAIVCISWGLVASSDIAGLVLRGARQRMDLQVDSSVTRFLSGIFKVVVLAIAAVILLSELNYNINGLITGLGLGGLTIALAAKDSASNFFGGVVLVVDKPFEIGDWVSCNGVEGTIEDINMRNTIIRNDSGSLTTMPNALLSAAPITNYSSAMNQRRADITLNLVYATPHTQIKEFVSGVREILETDPEIVSDSVLVRFANLGESSLGVRVIFYTSLPGLAEHLRIRERINYAILDLAEQHGIAFAYPTRTVALSTAPGTSPGTASISEPGPRNTPSPPGA